MAARLLKRHDPLRDATSLLFGKAGIWHRGREPFTNRPPTTSMILTDLGVLISSPNVRGLPPTAGSGTSKQG